MAQRKNETREGYNLRMASYMKQKYDSRREDAIAYLGGKCQDCGTVESLEFDHNSNKAFNIAHRLNGAPWLVLLAELDKCTLRCISCHSHMTAFRKLANVNLLG